MKFPIILPLVKYVLLARSGARLMESCRRPSQYGDDRAFGQISGKAIGGHIAVAREDQPFQELELLTAVQA